VCTLDLKVEGDSIRSYGQPSVEPVIFGQDVISLECGHRLHRNCLIQWLTIGEAPTCPMCRQETEWEPDIKEERSIYRLMKHSWSTLDKKEHSFIKIVWIIALIFAMTDPIGFTIVSSILLTFTPPILFPQVVLLFAFFRANFVSHQPGVRLSMSFAVASLLTVLAITNHEMRSTTVL